LTPRAGFRGALAFYPGCGLENKFKTYNPYAPVRVLIGTADEEVSSSKCQALVEGSRGAGHDISLTLYPEASHDFDDPGRRRQSVSANAFAARDGMEKAAQFMRERLAP
jgi:carboxymethylenebutenolidase